MIASMRLQIKHTVFVICVLLLLFIAKKILDKQFTNSTSPYEVKVALQTPLLTLSKCVQKYHLLILVTSHPENSERRRSIRTTWGSKWHYKKDLPLWRTAFQLGHSDDVKVRKETTLEEAEYEDMIFGDFPDAFFNLPIKIIMGFEWATKFCDFDYLLKTDDDVFVNVPNVFKFLSMSYIPSSRLYAGNVRFTDVPIRNSTDEREQKYMVTTQEYPYRNYPRYCSGGGIVLSRDVAVGMVNIHNNSNYFKLDDVYIGMLALRLGVDAHHEKTFRLQVTNCDCDSGLIVKHFGDQIDCMNKLYQCLKI